MAASVVLDSSGEYEIRVAIRGGMVRITFLYRKWKRLDSNYATNMLTSSYDMVVLVRLSFSIRLAKLRIIVLEPPATRYAAGAFGSLSKK